jgi:sensor histidine kinase YesM
LFLAALTLASLIFGIANTIQKRRNKLKEEILVMQQRLLRTQMNPHFVFNSLLSIQNFIYKNEPSIAGKYLSRFAKLIRLILNSSRKDYITLEDEIQFLNHYLDLQKLRFNERFDYSFEIDKKIKPEVLQIPPMLAQPFIENSIEHGLKNILHKGLIIIRFFLENDTLVFEIEDNGVGIYHAKKKEEASSPKHESLGQQITTDRLRLLDQSRGKKVSFNIKELRDEKNNVKGTKVSFRIAL